MCVIQGKMCIACNWLPAVVDSSAKLISNYGNSMLSSAWSQAPPPVRDIDSVTMETSQAPSLGKVPLASLFTWEQSGDRVCRPGQEQSEDMVHTLARTAQCLHQHPSIIQTMCCTHGELGVLCNGSSCSCQEEKPLSFPRVRSLA